MSSPRPVSSERVAEEPKPDGDAPTVRPPGENLFAALLLIVALALLWQAYRIAGFSALGSPGAFPMAASAAMVLALLVVLGKGLRQRRARAARAAGEDSVDARPARPPVAPRVIVVFAGFVLGFALLLDTLGFLPASLLFLVVAIGFLHRGSPLFTLLVSVGSLALVYVMFRLVFSVILPEGIVPESAIMAWVESLFAAGEGTR